MSKDRLIITTMSIDKKQNLLYFQRGFATGEFTYTGGRLTKAAFTSAGANNVTIINGTIAYEDAWLQQFENPRTVTSFRSSGAWQIINESTEPPTYYANFANNLHQTHSDRQGIFRFFANLTMDEYLIPTGGKIPSRPTSSDA